VADNQAWNAESTEAAAGADGLPGEFTGKTWSRGFSAAPLPAGPTMPKVTTETAWPSTTIGQDQQGKLYVNLFLSAAKLKWWSYTLIYLMFEHPANVGYGLFTQDGKPKLAGTYLHSLTTILGDTASGFTPTGLSYSIASEPATVHDLVMQKSTGTYELAVWSDSPVGGGSKNITVDLGNTFSTVRLYDVTKGTAPVQVFTNVNSIFLNLTDHAVILDFARP